MELSAIRFKQNGGGKEQYLYATAMSAEDLARLAEPYAYSAGSRPDGYQRLPAEHRFRDISNFVLNRDGLLPTAILVNIRDVSAATFIPDEGDANGQRGTLRVSSAAKLWVVDGQHRLFGLKRAAEEKFSKDPESSLGYEVPVVFTIGHDLEQERDMFYVVNSKAKSVPTDLAAEIIRRMVTEKGKKQLGSTGLNERDYRKAVGMAVAAHLNQAPGAWRGKIRFPNEGADRKNKPLQMNTISASLDGALKDHYLKSIYEAPGESDKQWPKLSGLVHTYWEALAQLMPAAFGDIEHHSVQRTCGANVFNQILPDVVYRCRDRRDFSIEGFKFVLKSLDKWVESNTWHIEDGEAITRATGLAIMRALASDLRDYLPTVDTPFLAGSS